MIDSEAGSVTGAETFDAGGGGVAFGTGAAGVGVDAEAKGSAEIGGTRGVGERVGAETAGGGGVGTGSDGASGAGGWGGGVWDVFSVGGGLPRAGSDMPKAARSSASNCDVSAIVDKTGLRGPLSWSVASGTVCAGRLSGRTTRGVGLSQVLQSGSGSGSGSDGAVRGGQWCLRGCDPASGYHLAMCQSSIVYRQSSVSAGFLRKRVGEIFERRPQTSSALVLVAVTQPRIPPAEASLAQALTCLQLQDSSSCCEDAMPLVQGRIQSVKCASRGGGAMFFPRCIPACRPRRQAVRK